MHLVDNDEIAAESFEHRLETIVELGGLIVGLGNPGQEYAGTRHNFGFMAIERLIAVCEKQGHVRILSGRSDPFHLWRCSTPGKPDYLICTPLTYMNKSGEAVQRVAAYYHIEPADIFVLHDELDIPLGRMKLKKGGGNAGHNGIRSIQQQLGTPDFFRLRLGIGKPVGYDAASFVLSKFRQEEKARLDPSLDGAVEGTLLFMEKGPKVAQQFCNSFALPEDEEGKARA